MVKINKLLLWYKQGIKQLKYDINSVTRRLTILLHKNVFS